MSNGQIFAVHDQPDAAVMTVNGVVYRCTVYLRTQAPARVEATCKIEQDNGDTVMVFKNAVVPPPSSPVTFVDCPRILASGSTFVVHWLEYEAPLTLGGPVVNPVIRRATMDMTAFSATTWTDQGSSALHTDLLYDHAPVVGSTDFVVTRKAVAAGTVNTTRYNGLSWVSTVWVTNTAVAITRCLSVCAHLGDGDVVIAYERTAPANQLWATRLNVSDGLGAATALTFTGFSNGDFWNVGLVRRAADRVVIVAEARLTVLAATVPDRYCHWLAYQEVNSTTAAPASTEHWVPHLNAVSRPWVCASGTTPSGGPTDVYMLASFKSVTDPDGWHQSRAFVINLQRRNWTLDIAGPEVRPQIVATASSVGVADGRISTASPAAAIDVYSDLYPQKRSNHLSTPCAPPPVGPDRRAYSIPAVVWSRYVAVRTTDTAIGQDRSELAPESASIVHYKFYTEDPWLAPRETGVSDPTRSFYGAYPRAMHQTVEAGRSLIVAGGCPSSFDGEQLVELGYPWAPEILRHRETEVSGSGGGELGLAVGTYQAYAVYVWTDAQGQVHRSGPSRIYTFTTTTDTQVIYTVRTMSMSMKGESVFYPMGQPITIEIYRTEAFALAGALAAAKPGDLPIGGSFYRVYGSNNPASAYRPADVVCNEPRNITVDINDAVQDAYLRYQGLGPYQFSLNYAITPMPPQTVPAMSVVAMYRNRVLMSTGEDQSTIWYSKEIRPDFGSDFYQAPEFSDTNTFRVDGVDEIAAMVGMGDLLIVFTRAGIATISGEFNNDLGQGASLSISPRHEGTGCIDPRSIVLAPPGIFFQSHKGYYLLDLSLDLDYVSAGASVEDLIREAGNISDATLLEDRHQVRLTVNGTPGFTRVVSVDVTTFDGTAEVYTFTFGRLDGATAAVIPYSRPASITDTAAAIGAAAVINAACARGQALYGVVASATNSGDDIVVTFVENVTTTSFLYVTTGTTAFTLVSDATTYTDAHPRVLIYDYLHRLWSEAPMVNVSSTTRSNRLVSGCAWRGYDGDVAHVALHEGGLHIERSVSDAAAFTDSTSTGNVGIPIDIVTAWLHLAGYAGMKRVWEVGVQAERRYAGAISVDVEYDDDGSYTGITPAYETFAWANPAPAYMPFRLTNQQVSGLTVRIYESVGITNNDTIAIVGLVFELGIQPGPRKSADAQRGT